jgi:hypothetical protein
MCILFIFIIMLLFFINCCIVGEIYKERLGITASRTEIFLLRFWLWAIVYLL